MLEPTWCPLLDRPGHVNTPTDRVGCDLLKDHAGPCAWSYHERDVYDDDACAAEEAHMDWYHWQTWKKIAPARHADADTESLDQPEHIREALQEWLWSCPKPEGSLILMGGVGSGKTWAACAVARYYQAVWGKPKNRQVRITSTVDMFRRLRPEGGGTAEDYIDPVLLVLDDVGIEKSSEWTEERLFEIIDARWRNMTPIIVTTNLTPAELKVAVGPRVYDRIRDGATALHLPGESRRAGSVSPKTGAA